MAQAEAKPLRVVVHGAAGRMGRQVIAAIAEDENSVVAAALDRDGHPHLGRDAGELASIQRLSVPLGALGDKALAAADVVIDFSSPASMQVLARACEQAKVPLVIGTTGLQADDDSIIDHLSRSIAVVVAPNFSEGVATMVHLVREAARLLGPNYDIEVVEMHHRRKVDAPSGTAVQLAKTLARARELSPERAFVHGRSGQVGARSSSEIGVFSLRGGDVVGDHTVILAGPGERIEITHRAHERNIFARGALRAAHWVVTQPKGRYTMADVLGVAASE